MNRSSRSLPNLPGDLFSCQTLDKLDVSCVEVHQGKISKVVDKGYDSFFERRMIDVNALRRNVFKTFARPRETIDSVLVLHYEIGTARHTLAFAFVNKSKCRALRFADTAGMRAWVDALFEGFAKAPASLIHFKTSSAAHQRVKDFGEGLIPELVRRYAPKTFDLRKMEAGTSEKNAFLRGFKMSTSNAQTVNPERTTELFKRYVAEARGASKKVVVKPGAKPGAIATLETKLGLKLPKEFTALYTCHNGGTNLFTERAFLPVAEVLKIWRAWKRIFDEWSMEDLLENSSGSANKTIGIYANPRWIPFARDAGGNYLAFDLMPGKKGKFGQIIEFGRDTDTIACLAPNLNTFLESLAKSKRTLR
jgi:cell wall assembly regulator SMI1